MKTTGEQDQLRGGVKRVRSTDEEPVADLKSSVGAGLPKLGHGMLEKFGAAASSGKSEATKVEEMLLLEPLSME